LWWGHTVQKGGRIQPRFGNRMFLIDTGMLTATTLEAGRQLWKSAANGKFIAVYLDQQVVPTRFDRVFASKRRAWGGGVGQRFRKE